MNEKEFYKQLMSEYSFNHEKIKKAAMSKVCEQEKKKTPLKWIASTCAAAVVIVSVGMVGVIALTQGGNPVTVTPTNSISIEDRFKLALEAYEKADQNTEEIFLYVTFVKEESPTDMQNILARADGTGEIKVIEVYNRDNTVISGSDNIKALFEADEENIVVVKIRCPGNFIKRLSRDKDVYLVETEAAFENSNFSAIDTNVSAPEMPEAPESEPENSTPEDTSSTEETTVQTPSPVVGDTTPPKEEEPAITLPPVTVPVTENTTPDAPQTEISPAPETEITMSESAPQSETTPESVSIPETE